MDSRRMMPSLYNSTGTTTRNETTTTTTSYETDTSNTTNPWHTTTPGLRHLTVGRSTGRPSTARPGTAATTRPRTGHSTLGVENQEIICAVSESRGISPTVGLAFVNLDAGEAVLTQLNDSQTYVRTTHKLAVFSPSRVLIVETAAQPKSKLSCILEDTLSNLGGDLALLDRRYWSEVTGLEYIQQLAFTQDVESVKTAVSGNYYAVCCFAAVLKYTELGLMKSFPAQSLRIKYEPSEGSMMIDLATIRSLELVQNLHTHKSKDCLFGLLNHTVTPMGARLLRSNILQPNTDPETLSKRYDVVEELSTKEGMFFSVGQALKEFLDVDKILTQLILCPLEPGLRDSERSINNVIMLKQFVMLVKPVFKALAGARCEMLQTIRNICASENTDPVAALIDGVINQDTTYAQKPLDLRNQRTYAVKSGANGLLDVARQTYKEAMTDALQHITDLEEEHEIQFQTRFDESRQFFLQLKADELGNHELSGVFINVCRKRDMIQCQTLDIVKRNQKIADAHHEVLLMSDASVKELIADVREHMFGLFRICESIAMLDMLCSFAHVVTTQDYTRPIQDETLAIRAGRHPIREKVHNTKFVPNDIYATQQTRFQIITGCNMSGKSTYIRSVALMAIMAQVGSFLPAQDAALPIVRQLFARVSMDDSIEANVSTFTAEMRETAFILQNVDRSSLVIMDELGRGTSTRDGLAIAIAIAEALVDSRALVWFATHFRDLAKILSERNGVINFHLAVDMSGDRMEMLYQIAQGAVEEEHYGIKLAKVLPLPPDVIEHAEHVSATLLQQMRKKQQHSVGVVHARRRKLLLNLKEHLIQAREGRLNDMNLKEWLKDLQKEFVVRMTALDEEMQRIVGGASADVEEVLDTVEDVDQTHNKHEDAEQEKMAVATTVDSSTGKGTFGSSSRNLTTTATS